MEFDSLSKCIHSMFVENTGGINNTKVMSYFNDQLFRQFQPDINGYTLIFFVPPPFLLIPDPSYIVNDLTKFITFAAIDFTPPQTQVKDGEVSSHAGGIPFAIEISATQQCSVTFLDNSDLSIYSFHVGWIEYMKSLIEGFIPNSSPGTFPTEFLPDKNGVVESGIDYVGSFYIVRYDPSMMTVRYIGKCTGVHPQNIPSKELIGQRSSNELVTLPFNYSCTFFEEALSSHHPIWSELETLVSIF